MLAILRFNFDETVIIVLEISIVLLLGLLDSLFEFELFSIYSICTWFVLFAALLTACFLLVIGLITVYLLIVVLIF